MACGRVAVWRSWLMVPGSEEHIRTVRSEEGDEGHRALAMRRDEL
jgi:hypothetical protein